MDIATPDNDSEFWFDDGSVILVADGIAFKVHASVLAQNSTVFRDMFENARAGPGEVVGGCSAVVMHDAPHELRCLLRAMYGSLRLLHPDVPPMPFKEVEILLRLARKYQMEDLSLACVKRLKSVFTDKLQVWRFVERTGSMEIASASLSVQLYDAPAVVHLARDIQEPTLLPTALYLCCRLSVADAPLDTSTWTLAPDDLQRCVLGACRLTHEMLQLCMTPGSASTGCRTKSACERQQQQMTDSLRVMQTPIFALLFLRDHVSADVCASCKESWGKYFDEHLQSIWEALPGYFKLETWDVLRTK